MTASATDIAWLAGFIDGEGTIGLARTNAKSHPTPYLRPHLQAPNTDYRAIEEMQRIFFEITGKKPSVCVSNKGDDRCRKAWRVKIATQWELMLILPTLIPHLRLKKRQAEIALEFCKRQASRYGHRGQPHRALDEAGYAECMALNARGVQPAASATVIEFKKALEN